MLNQTLERISDRMRTAPNRVLAHSPGPNHPNQASDWRATVNGTRNGSLLTRFEAHFTRTSPDECWEWRGDVTPDGYGRFSEVATRAGRKRVVASRFALEVAAGAPASADMRACHTCDNPPCVNPRHLYWGTDLDNTRDAINRNRRADTSKPRTVFDRDQVSSIRARHASGETIISLANEHEVNRMTIRRMVNGITYQDGENR